MRKITLAFTMLSMAISLFAQITVQGIPYSNPKNRTLSTAIKPMSGTTETTFTFDNIENWSGEGENQAAFVVQWNVEGETSARVYGYRWDGTAYGVDMVQAVCANNPDLYCLIQYTGSMGYTICGIGFDADGDGEIGIKDSSDGKTYTSENGIFIHPRGAESGGSPSYDYDNWSAIDSDDYWASGWYTNGYWSYWVSSSGPANFSYSGLGASSRQLTSGCWDGWSFMQGFSSSSWKDFVSAPSLIPEGATTQFYVDGIYYVLDSYKNKTVLVSAPFEINGSTGIYSGDITIPATFSYYDSVSDAEVNYTVVGVADSAFSNASISSILLPETATKIGKEAFKNSTLASINISDNITKLGNYAFYGCSNLIGTAIIPTSLTVIPEGLYGGTNITSLMISNNITSIGDYAFENCMGLDSLSLGETLNTIGSSAFNGCVKLERVNFPATISSISTGAFAGCDGLTSVVVNQTIPLTITDDVFSSTAYANATLTVPLGYSSTYAEAAGWRNFTKQDEIAIAVNVGDYFETGGVAYVVTAIDETIKTVSVSNYQATGTSNSLIAAANKAGYSGDVIVPNKVTYQNIEFEVSDMLTKVFYGASEMTSIKFENSFATLPTYALYNCSALTSVEFPDSMTALGDWSMFGCSALTEIYIPETVTVIGSRVFYDCSGLTSVSLPENLESLGAYTFNGCKNITTIVIPDKIKELGDYLFSGCSSLTSIDFASDLTKIGQRTFSDCSSLTEFTIPQTVTSLGQYAFAYTSLTHLTIPDTITSLPSYLFLNCKSLTSVTMNNVTTIGTQTFANCTALETFVSPEALTTIGNYAFKGCTNLKNVIIGDKVTKLGNYAFQNCTSLTTLEIPASVTSLGSNLVSGCSSNLDIFICNPEPISWSYKFNTTNSSTIAPINVVYGSKSAYEAASGWKNSVVNEVIPVFLIENDSITIVDLTAGLTNMPYEENVPLRFRCANVEALKNAGVTVALEYREAISLETDVSDDKYTSEPATIMNEGSYQAEAKSLNENTTYEYHWVLSISDSDTIYSETGNFSTAELSVSDWFIAGDVAYVITAYDKGNGEKTVSVCYNDYTNVTENYGDKTGANSNYHTANKALYSGDIVIPATVEYMGVEFNVTGMTKCAFAGATEITSLTIEAPIEHLGNYALYGCTKLTSVQFSDCMKTIGDWSMYGCTSLAEINIPESVTEIGSRVFYNCPISEIILPDSLISLGGYTFYGTKLSSIVIPDGVKVLEDHLFNGCSNLSSITFASDLTKIGQRVFNACTSLSEFEIPATVTSLGQYAFAGSGIKSISIPESVKSVPAYLCLGCSNLTEVRLNKNITSIGNQAFQNCVSLKSIELPDSLLTLGNYVFRYDVALEKIAIPASVSSIGRDVFTGCTNVKVYMCNPNPCTLTNNLNTATGVYAPVYVIYGAKSHYEADSKWNLSEITEVVPEQMFDMDSRTVEIVTNNAVLSIPMCSIYEEDIPEKFTMACDDVVMPATIVTVEYRVVTEADDTVQTISDETVTSFNTIDATLLENNIYMVDFKNTLEYNTRYEYYWIASLGSVEVARSEADYFRTSTTTGIDNIKCDVDTNAVYYDLRGARINAENLKPGIYIKVLNGNVSKILIDKK